LLILFAMVKQYSISGGFLRRKVFTIAMVVVSAAAAFATLGDGGDKDKKKGLLSNHYTNVKNTGKFSLKSGYQYRGSQIISQNTRQNTVSLNSVIIYKNGNTTYIVPFKTNPTNTKVDNKVKFSLGVPSINK